MDSCDVHILCVDDDTDSCELIEHLLTYKENSYFLKTVSSPGKALNLIKKQSFDLYIFDYALPEMSGVELCRYIRSHDTKTPILFFSAKAYPDDRETAILAGANEYLVKPNDLDRFKESVKRLLAQRSKAEFGSRDYENPDFTIMPNL